MQHVGLRLRSHQRLVSPLRIVCAVAILLIGASSGASGRQGQSEVVVTSTDPVEIPDVAMQQFQKIQRVLGVPSSIRFSMVTQGDVGSARPVCAGDTTQVPSVVFNFSALEDLDDSDSDGVNAVFAHELSHILQFMVSPAYVQALCSGKAFDEKTYELLADFGAGYAMYKLGKTDDQLSFVRTIAALSDYRFSSVHHHGMVVERMNAFNIGQAAAYSGRPLDMAVLLRNQKEFLRMLDGPSRARIERDQTMASYAQETLRELYK